MISHYCGGITPDWFMSQPARVFYDYRDFVKDIEKKKAKAAQT